MGHQEFLATQAAKSNSRAKRRQILRKSARGRKISASLDILVCSLITIGAFFVNVWLGAFIFLTLLLPEILTEWRGQVTRPPWTTVKGDPDCPECKGKYFMSNGFLTYWLGWKECNSCTPDRVFNKK